MKKYAFYILIGSLLLANAFAFGNTDRINRLLDTVRVEMESLEKEQDMVKVKKLCPVISMNLGYLQDTISRKLNRLQERVEQYSAQMQTNEDEYEVEFLQNKIDQAQKKIETLQKLMQTIDMWKAKLVQCC